MFQCKIFTITGLIAEVVLCGEAVLLVRYRWWWWERERVCSTEKFEE